MRTCVCLVMTPTGAATPPQVQLRTNADGSSCRTPNPVRLQDNLFNALNKGSSFAASISFTSLPTPN